MDHFLKNKKTLWIIEATAHIQKVISTGTLHSKKKKNEQKSVH
jgi:hypothetical protein